MSPVFPGFVPNGSFRVAHVPPGFSRSPYKGDGNREQGGNAQIK
jgi:hypothetical protein